MAVVPQAAWYGAVRSAEMGASAALSRVLDWMTAQAHVEGFQPHARFAAEGSGTLGGARDPLHEGCLGLIVEVSNS